MTSMQLSGFYNNIQDSVKYNIKESDLVSQEALHDTSEKIKGLQASLAQIKGSQFSAIQIVLPEEQKISKEFIEKLIEKISENSTSKIDVYIDVTNLIDKNVLATKHRIVEISNKYFILQSNAKDRELENALNSLSISNQGVEQFPSEILGLIGSFLEPQEQAPVLTTLIADQEKQKAAIEEANKDQKFRSKIREIFSVPEFGKVSISYALSEQCKNVEQLDLSGIKLTVEHIRFLFKLFPNIKILELERTCIKEHIKVLVEQVKASRLTSLGLRNNNIKAEEAKTLAALKDSQLTSLNLASNEIGAEGAKALAVFKDSQLMNLDLEYNKIGAEGTEALAVLKDSQLTSLNLASNEIRDEGAKALAVFKDSQLTSLNLASNKIGDEGAKALVVMKDSKLMSLNLGWNYIGDEGAKALAVFKDSKLMILSLHGNNIGDEGAKALAVFKDSQLTSLNLASNKIGDEGAKALAVFKDSQLTSLNLASNKIGDEGAKAPAVLERLQLEILDQESNNMDSQLTRSVLSQSFFDLQMAMNRLQQLSEIGEAVVAFKGRAFH
jgi:hypothetical protein